jgi:hypothetical protein
MTPRLGFRLSHQPCRHDGTHHRNGRYGEEGDTAAVLWCQVGRVQIAHPGLVKVLRPETSLFGGLKCFAQLGILLGRQPMEWAGINQVAEPTEVHGVKERVQSGDVECPSGLFRGGGDAGCLTILRIGQGIQADRIVHREHKGEPGAE